MSNKIEVTGNVVYGKDKVVPSLKVLPSGKSVINFTIADSRKSGGTDENPEFTTVFFPCVAWEEEAHKIANELVGLPEGQKLRLTVKGSLSEDPWTDKDGNERKSFKITVYEATKPLPSAGYSKSAPVTAVKNDIDSFLDGEEPF